MRIRGRCDCGRRACPTCCRECGLCGQSHSPLKSTSLSVWEQPPSFPRNTGWEGWRHTLCWNACLYRHSDTAALQHCLLFFFKLLAHTLFYMSVSFLFFLIFFIATLFIYLFIYFWLFWVFVSVRGLSLVAASGGHSSSRWAGLSLSRPVPLRSTGSRCAGSVIVAHGPSCSAASGIFPDQGSNPCPLH